MSRRSHAACDQRLYDLRFEGITFSHTEWQPPSDYASSLQAGVEMPGALFFDYTERCGMGGIRTHMPAGPHRLSGGIRYWTFRNRQQWDQPLSHQLQDRKVSLMEN
ncbi:MAG TPA: hypothetical protein P5186_10025 [Candidatus Paceibacterota bacterium]|nr:hypothetical protein [Verrucomicrobiota bacterium]HRY48373.1 hypothetical protein [Candidatus Paceibacterota bacterium]